MDYPKVRQVGKILGVNCIQADYLVPKTRDSARPNTLSSMFGLRAFPIHTDFSTRSMPSRYIILSAPRPRDATTRLYDGNRLTHVFQDKLKESIFLVHGIRNPFASRFVDSIDGEPLVRYNPAVMKPLNKIAEELSSYIDKEWSWDIEINWQQCRYAIIDNWRCLHSRSDVKDETVIKSGLWRFAMGGKK